MNKESISTEELTGFLNSWVDSIEQENIELFKKIIENSQIKEFDGPEEFFYAVLYPWENFIKGFIKSTISSNRDVVFIFQHSNYIDRHFSDLFHKHEGNMGCSDKSRTIVNRLLKFYATGEKIEFDYSGEYTYHLPDKIFKTHDEIVEFYEGLKSFMWGRPEKYIEAYKKQGLDKS